jgi:hypothetical protein
MHSMLFRQRKPSLLQNVGVFATFHTNCAHMILKCERTKKEKKSNAMTKTSRAIVDMVLKEKERTSGN